MKKFLMSLVLMVCVFVSSFGADKSLETVKEKGYFIVGLDATFAPMGYRDESGEIVGFDIDLAKEVAKRMGVEARFKPCEWDAIIFDLRSKNIDMVWNGMTITPARAKQVAFTKPYLSAISGLSKKKASDCFQFSSQQMAHLSSNEYASFKISYIIPLLKSVNFLNSISILPPPQI